MAEIPIIKEKIWFTSLESDCRAVMPSVALLEIISSRKFSLWRKSVKETPKKSGHGAVIEGSSACVALPDAQSDEQRSINSLFRVFRDSP